MKPKQTGLDHHQILICSVVNLLIFSGLSNHTVKCNFNKTEGSLEDLSQQSLCFLSLVKINTILNGCMSWMQLPACIRKEAVIAEARLNRKAQVFCIQFEPIQGGKAK